MLKNIRKRSEGFTIIEVLIVLAIAGLILLIVFLAVPALQRNSRNTAIKNDAQNVLGGVSEFMGANNGKLPTNVAGTGKIVYTAAATDNETSINVQGSTVVSTPGAMTINADGPGGGKIEVFLGTRCDGTSSTRAVAAVYSIETAGDAAVWQCAES